VLGGALGGVLAGGRSQVQPAGATVVVMPQAAAPQQQQQQPQQPQPLQQEQQQQQQQYNPGSAPQYYQMPVSYPVPPNAPIRPPPLLHSKARVRKDFTAEHETEMSIKEGETVEIVTESHSGWTLVVVDGTGAQGWVPASFLQTIVS
jgi:hypothetical protein